MFFTLLLMTPLILLALVALVIRDTKWAILAWVLMALTMVPVWLLLALPEVALAQVLLAAGMTGWWLWRSYRESVADR